VLWPSAFLVYALDVQTWAAPWIRPNPPPTGGAFDLQLWAKGGTGYIGDPVSAHSSYVIQGPSSTLFGPSISLYYLGNKNQFAFGGFAFAIARNLSFSPPAAVNFFDIFDNSPSLYTEYSQNKLAVENKICFKSDTGYVFFGNFNLTGTSDSYNDPQFSSPEFHFYDLTGDGLPGYWLGAFAFVFQQGSIADWASMPEDYMDLVFLFGSEPIAVPEPQVYLLLGTLLGVVALVAKRKKQIA
jgi:hypothetical protein